MCVARGPKVSRVTPEDLDLKRAIELQWQLGLGRPSFGEKLSLGPQSIDEEAAVWLAVVKRDMKAQHNGKLFAPPKIDKPHKPRAKPAVPAMASPLPLQPPQLPMATAVAVPMLLPMAHLPFALALPIPMQPLGDA